MNHFIALSLFVGIVKKYYYDDLEMKINKLECTMRSPLLYQDLESHISKIAIHLDQELRGPEDINIAKEITTSHIPAGRYLVYGAGSHSENLWETIPENWHSFRDQVTSNFRIISHQNSRVLD